MDFNIETNRKVNAGVSVKGKLNFTFSVGGGSAPSPPIPPPTPPVDTGAIYGAAVIQASGVLSSSVICGTATIIWDESRIAVVLLDENDEPTSTMTHYDTLSDAASYLSSHTSDRYLVNIGSRSGTTAIGASCFRSCTSLARVNIPNTVTAIGSSAFSGCTGLALVDIPSSVSAIGADAFSGTTCTVVVDGAQNRISGAPWGADSEQIVWNDPGTTLYSFRVNKSDPTPKTRVEYLYDAVGKAPAYMDTAAGQFHYGGWADAWFVIGNKPVALGYDGTVDYELDPDDYTKKADGTASDVSDSSYAGNFMAAIPLCWVYRFESAMHRYYMIADRQAGDGFKAYAHTDATGTVKSVFYAPMFKGSITDGKLRSVVGVMPGSYAQYANEIAAAQSCGSGWQIWDWAKHELIADLLTLISRSTDSQSAFGEGNTNTDNDTAPYYGKLETGSSGGGQFWGGTDQQQVKVFHIEGFWGDRWERCMGLHLVSGVYTYKMTAPYSMSPDAGYTDSGIRASSGNGYQSAQRCGEFGTVPIAQNGSESTYECDLVGCNVNLTTGMLFGGAATHKKYAGSRFFEMSVRVDNYGYTYGASPVYC